MIKSIVCAMLLAYSGAAYSQNLFSISLTPYTVNTDSISFKISEVIDARTDTKVVGIVHRGVGNRKDLAVFKNPGVVEIEGLMQSSGLISKEKGVVMRISKLYISEITSLWKETAKAELSADFFIPYEGKYYYITSVYSTVESHGGDVTLTHADNIFAVVENALVQFSKKANAISSEQPYGRDELSDPNQHFRSIINLPIVTADRFSEGYFASFEEFLTNKPSLSLHCYVKLNSTPVVKCGNEEKQISVYGYSRDNQLYIAFHQKFYPVEKIDDEFFFYGPREITGKDIEDTYKAMIVPGQLGSKKGHTAQYRIDLVTGSIEMESGFKVVGLN